MCSYECIKLSGRFNFFYCTKRERKRFFLVDIGWMELGVYLVFTEGATALDVAIRRTIIC
jgi:hypothetical protein